MGEHPTRTITKVVVVGGPSSIVNTMRRHFSGFDIKVVAHLANVIDAKGKSYNVPGYPPGTEGVVCLVDTTSHAVSESAKASAKKADIPFVAVPRKWSKAEPVLRTHGFLPPATNGDVKEPTRKEIQDVALAYTCGEMALGRTPSYEEVQGALQRAFGPQINFKKSLFRTTHSIAARRTPVLPDMKTKVTQTMSLSDWVWALIEERPERLLDLRTLTRDIAKDKDIHASYSQVEKIVESVDFRIRSRFRSNAPKDRAWGNPIVLKWAERQLSRSLKDHGKLTSRLEMSKESKGIFGVGVSSDIVKQARGNVLGDWALETLRHKQAYEYYRRQSPNEDLTLSDFMGLLQGGGIKSFYSGKILYTSKMALDEYLSKKGVAKSIPKKPWPKRDSPKAETTSPGSNLGPQGSYKAIAEEVALEVLSLFQGVVDKKLSPIKDSIAKIESSIEQSHRVLLERVEAAEASAIATAEALPQFGENLVESMQTIAKPVSSVRAKVDTLLRDTQAIKGTLEITRDKIQSALNKFPSLGPDAYKGTPVTTRGSMTLRELGEMAKDTGLKVLIQTPDE